MKSIIGTSIAVCLLGGCASMFHGSSQQVSIRSNNPDTELYVNEMLLGKGNVVTSFKKKENYMITARRDGCNAMTVPAAKSFDATTLLGVFIDFGIISILVIDGAATGAWNKFDQTSYILDPQCPIAKVSFTKSVEKFF
jgi:hypothetical protein